MNLQTLVTSQELAHQLYDRGYRGETLFWWSGIKGATNEDLELLQWDEIHYRFETTFQRIPAPTLNELLERLPEGYDMKKEKGIYVFTQVIDWGGDYEALSTDQLPQNACTKLLITLHDEGIINLAEM